MYTVYSESRNVSVQEKPLTLRNTRSGTVWSVRQSHWTHEWDASHGAICITVLIQTHSKIVSLKHVRYIDQAVKFSVDLRNSAVSPVFLVIFEISANLRRSWKVWLEGGGISESNWPTGMVHLPKSAGVWQYFWSCRSKTYISNLRKH